MVVTVESKLAVVAKEHDEKGLQVGRYQHYQLLLPQLLNSSKGPVVSTTAVPSLESIEITRKPTEDGLETSPGAERRSTFHIYQKHKCHKCISPTIDPLKERRLGPTIAQRKAQRKENKERTNSGLPLIDPDEHAFFLHRPYLAFHVPPHVLYMGNSKRNAKPVVLIHEGCFWREYKLQLGLSISKPGALDPRGVVSWRHNGGDRKALKADDRRLKGYKVRTWRLWGETGKEYVHTVKAHREAGEGLDPDVLLERPAEAAEAEEVVYLRWMNPLSRHTRCYYFRYAGIDLYWKGTGKVKEERLGGFLLRFNHLKLIARLPPGTKNEKEKEHTEVVLGTYRSSVAKMKNGTLEFVDAAILRLIDEHVPLEIRRSLLKETANMQEDNEAARILRMKTSTMYQVFVATAMCMIKAEKEKRHTLVDLILNAAEQGGGAG
jgi:hypothetical protein